MSFLGKIIGSVQRRALALGEKINSFSDPVLVAALSCFYFLWRILALPIFEFSGDAVWKWRFLRYFRETGCWLAVAPEHHQGRWCQNLPVYWCMQIFDSAEPWVGAVIPVLTGFFLLLILWLITRSIASRLSAVLVWLTTMLCPVFICESAQFLPSLPAAMYTLLALYLMILYLQKPSRWFLPLCAGVVMGLAWGCKVTSVYWLAGIALFLMFHPVAGRTFFRGKRFRLGMDVLLLGAGFLLVLIPETIILNRFFHVFLGRISMLMGHTGANPNLYAYNLLEYFFSPALIFLDVIHGKIIHVLPPALLFLLMISPVILQLRDRQLPLKQRLLTFCLLVALIFHCYFVVRVFPFKHPERPLPRYFATLYYVSFIILYTARPLLPAWKNRFGCLLKTLFCGIFAVMLIVMFLGWINDPVINRDNLFSTADAISLMRRQQREDLPLLVRCQKGKNFTTRTFKLAKMGTTFLAPAEELAAISTDEKKLYEAWKARPPVQTEDGVCYFYVLGKRPVPGKQELCIVVKDESWSLQSLPIRAEEMKSAEKEP